MGRTLKTARNTRTKSRTSPAKGKASHKPVARTSHAPAKSAIPSNGHGSHGVLKPVRTYKTALDYLGAQVNYERRPPTAKQRSQMTLNRMKRLMTDLGNPHKSFRSVHIAGTKGKGSTATMLYHMLRSNQMTVGLYTSPHINDIRERIIVNDQMIPESAMTKYIAKISQVSQNY